MFCPSPASWPTPCASLRRSAELGSTTSGPGCCLTAGYHSRRHLSPSRYPPLSLPPPHTRAPSPHPTPPLHAHTHATPTRSPLAPRRLLRRQDQRRGAAALPAGNHPHLHAAARGAGRRWQRQRRGWRRRRRPAQRRAAQSAPGQGGGGAGAFRGGGQAHAGVHAAGRLLKPRGRASS